MTTPLRDRRTLETLERQCLAPYAAFAAFTCGRSHPEPEHDLRTCYQRDRDRIIHAAAFRRLEAKTQVFLGAAGDYARTRLTHTIEVAQVARTMARLLAVNEDLAEAVALAHDLGHPPYGHCGEDALNELMAGHGGFEHNRHALRVVEYLEHPYPAFRGLNLTFETRLGLAKHRTRYDHPANADAVFGSGGPCLEGQIVDLADAIAYNSHDLDDALAAGLIGEQQMDDVVLYQLAREQVAAAFPDAKPKARQLRTAKTLIDMLVRRALEETACRLEQLAPQSLDDIRSAPESLVALPDPWDRHLDQLADFLRTHVYEHPRLAQAVEQARREIASLFTKFCDQPHLLPRRYRRRVDEQGPARVACDYLAGMTDRFCHQLATNPPATADD